MTGLLALDAAMTAAGAFSWALIPAVPVDPLFHAIYINYIREGRHGSMDWAARYTDVRHDPRLLLRDAGGPPVAGLLMCLFAYPSPEEADAARRPDVPRIADYALAHADYHRVIKARLAPVTQLVNSITGAPVKICVDSAPLRERYWAARAGLGRVTRSGHLVVPGFGSNFHIAAIAIGDSAQAAALMRHARRLLPPPVMACPPGCNRCLRACPTQALRADGSLDARHCISYLTIEAPGGYNPVGKAAAKPVLYGCDECRRACPLTLHATACTLPVPELRADAALGAMTADDWRAMSSSCFSRRYRGTALGRVTHALLLKNIKK